jgi:gamma-glutamylcyclotransferase (GGCT)/AIG2-like uncharacterized protein YtfP
MEGMVYLVESFYVFVYGSLRKLGHHNRILANAPCAASQSWTTGALFDSGSGFPCMVQSEGRVYGELYIVNKDQLAAIDKFKDFYGQGCEHHFERVIQTVMTDKGPKKAYVYILKDLSQAHLMERVENGDWGVHVLLKQKELLYFAYGSCMDNERFAKAGVGHYFRKIKGIGILNGFTLRFTRKSLDGGRADIVEEGGRVEGKVYEIPRESLSYLYKREGVAAGCYRPAVVSVMLTEKLFKNVLTFIVVEKEAETAPPGHYAAEILRGAYGYASEGYLEQLKLDLHERFYLNVEDGA